MKRTIVLLIVAFHFSFSYGQKPRARDLGVPFSGNHKGHDSGRNHGRNQWK